MGYIAHLRKQLKSINTYDYIITLTKRRKKPLLSLWKLHVNGSSLNKIESHSPEDALCQVWLKLAQWFWRRFFNFFNVFLLFLNDLPWKRAGPFIWRNLNLLHPRMLCAKFGWNWPSGSWEEVKNRESLQTDRQTDRQTDDGRKGSEKLSWAFSSGELKTQLAHIFNNNRTQILKKK